MSELAGSIEDPSKLSPKERWAEEINMAEKELKTFLERGRRVTKRFLDERDLMDAQSKWFNIFYANTEIMSSALYAQLPKPSVSRRFKDYDDDVARVAAMIIQRSITQDLDDPRDTFDSTMRQCVQDRLVPGLSMAWLRLETDTEDIEDIPPQPDMETDEVGEIETVGETIEGPMKRITDQRVIVDYVFWADFLWSPCRIWEERRWIARKVYMSREELIDRFGDKIGKQVPLDFKPTNAGQNVQGSTPQHEALQKAVVYEIWERDTRKVFWYCKGLEFILDEMDDPLHLVGFEPCPTPMLANITTSNTTPRPDYFMLQDQYTELDTVNNRISMLIQACKVVGVYDKSAVGVSRMLTEGFDNQLIPVDNWAMFAEKGGLKGQVDWLPLDVIVQSLQQLIQAREQIKGQIYEITGISDIVRGASKASETLGAQQIKSQFASIRIKKLQDEVARFAGEILRIKAEIQVKHFSPEFLIAKSNIMATGNDQFIQPALDLLSSDEGFEWRIQVTSDSIAQADYAMEKADRIEFLNAVSGYIEKTMPMIQQMPGTAPLLINMLKWTVAGFRNASDIENILDKELDALTKNPPQKAPDPKQAEAQAKMQADQAKSQADMAIQQAKGQTEQQKGQMEIQKMQAEMAMQEKMNAMEIQMKHMELQFEQQKLEMEKQKMMMELNFKGAETQANLQAKAAEQEMQIKAQAQTHQQNAEFTQQSHEQKLKQMKEMPKKEPVK